MSRQMMLFQVMLRLLILMGTLMITISCRAKDDGPKFTTKKMSLAGKTLTVEIADSDQLRSQGLMFRKSLEPEHGMLFIFDSQRTLNFWMKNTFLPLSIGFFDQEQTLVDVQDMTPVKSMADRNVPQYQSARPAKYALEVNQGWFKKNNVPLGSKFKFE